MTIQTVRATIPISCLFGFLSGLAGFWMATWVGGGGEKTGEDGVVRARRIELIDAGGRSRGIWEVRDAGMASLQFLDETGKSRVELADARGSQMLVFREQNGRLRAALVTDSTGMSALHLGDHVKEARVTVGAIAEEDIPSMQPPESWGLALHGPGAFDHYLAAYVKGTPRSGQEETRIVLRRGAGATWTAP